MDFLICLFKIVFNLTQLLNFRSPACFEIGWPMRTDHDFFCTKKSPKPQKSKKTNVEEKLHNDDDEEMGVCLLPLILCMVLKNRLSLNSI